MTKCWQQLVRRVDTLSLRERVFIFISVSCVFAATVDALVLGPQAATQQAVARRLQAQQAELQSLREQQAAGDTAHRSPAGRMAAALQRLQAQRREVDAEIQRRLDTPQALELQPLLERLLRRHERLMLLQLAAGAALASPAELQPRQAVELGLRGSYADLTAYVDDLGAALPGLRWDELLVQRREGVAELKARFSLPGPHPASPAEAPQGSAR